MKYFSDFINGFLVGYGGLNENFWKKLMKMCESAIIRFA